MGSQVLAFGVFGGIFAVIIYFIFRDFLPHTAYSKPALFFFSVVAMWLLAFVYLQKQDIDSFVNLGGVVLIVACYWGGLKLLGENLKLAQLERTYGNEGVSKGDGNNLSE